MGVEEAALGILEVAPAGVDFPSLGVTHSPELDETVIASGDDERHCWVEGDPVHTAIVSLENKLDNGVGVAKHIGLVLVRSSDLVLET